MIEAPLRVCEQGPQWNTQIVNPTEYASYGKSVTCAEGTFLNLAEAGHPRVDNVLAKVRLIDLVSLRAGGVGGNAETRFPKWQGNNALRRTISSPTGTFSKLHHSGVSWWTVGVVCTKLASEMQSIKCFSARWLGNTRPAPAPAARYKTVHSKYRPVRKCLSLLSPPT